MKLLYRMLLALSADSGDEGDRQGAEGAMVRRLNNDTYHYSRKLSSEDCDMAAASHDLESGRMNLICGSRLMKKSSPSFKMSP